MRSIVSIVPGTIVLSNAVGAFFFGFRFCKICIRSHDLAEGSDAMAASPPPINSSNYTSDTQIVDRLTPKHTQAQ